MYLEGQGGQRGYAMAALLMSVGVMAIVMSALLPVWRQQAQREKEAELAFRGEQYARAIYLFNRQHKINPPSIDALVQGRFLRKKYKDPMTEDGEFLPLAAGANQPGQPGPQSQPGPQGQPPPGVGQSGRGVGGGGVQPFSGQVGRGGQPGTGLGGGTIGGVQGGGGILRVVSKSKESSIRIYYGAAHYNEWQFIYNRQGRGGPGRIGGPGGGPVQGQPGMGPGGSGIGSGGRGRSGAGPGTAPGGAGPGRGPGRGSINFPGGRGQ